MWWKKQAKSTKLGNTYSLQDLKVIRCYSNDEVIHRTIHVNEYSFVNWSRSLTNEVYFIVVKPTGVVFSWLFRAEIIRIHCENELVDFNLNIPWKTTTISLIFKNLFSWSVIRVFQESMCPPQLITEEEGLSRLAHIVQVLVDLADSPQRKQETSAALGSVQ